MKVAVSDLEEKGYLLIDFPSELSETLLSHVKSVIHKKLGNKQEDLTASVMRASDKSFEQLFDKTERIFPDEITQLVLEWAQRYVVKLLDGKSMTTNAPWPHRQNTVENQKYSGSFDFYWRLVRPHKKDIGAAHTDRQFWDIAREFYGDAFCDQKFDERWKTWIPIFGCDPSNSLQVISGSHHENVPVQRRVLDDGVVKPDIDHAWLHGKENDFHCPFDTCNERAILFHDDLVHRGPMNTTDSIRISAELTVLLKR